MSEVPAIQLGMNARLTIGTLVIQINTEDPNRALALLHDVMKNCDVQRLELDR